MRIRNLVLSFFLALALLIHGGCATMKSQGDRTAGGALIGAGGGAALGAIIGSAFGVPGLGALIGAGGGAIIGGATGALWPEKGSNDYEEARKISAMGYMSYEQFRNVLVNSRLSADWQNNWLAYAGTLKLQADEMGKDIRFIVGPEVGLGHILSDKKS